MLDNKDLIPCISDLCSNPVRIIRRESDVAQRAFASDPFSVAENFQESVSGINHDPFRPFPHNAEPQNVQIKLPGFPHLLSTPAFHGNMMYTRDHCRVPSYLPFSSLACNSVLFQAPKLLPARNIHTICETDLRNNRPCDGLMIRMPGIMLIFHVPGTVCHSVHF